MGWSIHIKLDKPVTEEVMTEIVDKLPVDIKGGKSRGGRQAWGWSLAVDVTLHRPNEVMLSGSYGLSGQIALAAAREFERLLKEAGYTVTVGEMS